MADSISHSTVGAPAEFVHRVVRQEGEVHWDRTKPDGFPGKLLTYPGARRSAGSQPQAWKKVCA